MSYDPTLSNLDRVRRKIRSDPKYKAIKNVYATDARFQIPVDGYRDEVRTMFKMRTYRGLTVNSPNFFRKFGESVLQDQSYRSRMTEMLTECYGSKRALERLLAAFTDYISVEYAKDLKPIGTIKDRDAFIRMVLAKFQKYLDRLDDFIFETDALIKDIDKAGFAAKNVAEVFNIVFQREGKLPNFGEKRK